jgi:hypothetical protein
MNLMLLDNHTTKYDGFNFEVQLSLRSLVTSCGGIEAA